MHTIDRTGLLTAYDTWAQQREELSEREPDVDADAWHASDDQAVDLLHSAVEVLRGSWIAKAPPETANGTTPSTEYQIVVVLDVTAGSRTEAAYAVTDVLGAIPGTKARDIEEPDYVTDNTVESWWLPEADLNDIDDMALVPVDVDRRTFEQYALDQIAAAMREGESPARVLHHVSSILRMAAR